MSMRTLQLGVFLALLVAARAVPAVVDVSNALGRPLQYDKLDRERPLRAPLLSETFTDLFQGSTHGCRTTTTTIIRVSPARAHSGSCRIVMHGPKRVTSNKLPDLAPSVRETFRM